MQPIPPLKLSETNHELFHHDSLRPAVSRLSIDARAGAPAFVSPARVSRGGRGSLRSVLADSRLIHRPLKKFCKYPLKAIWLDHERFSTLDAFMAKERVKRSRKGLSEVSKSVASYANREGNYLERKQPDKAIQALEMLAEGSSYGMVKAQLGLNWETISRLKARHHMALEQRRGQLAEDALDLVEGFRLLQKEKMKQLAEDPEQLARTNIKDLAIPWGIANDKFLSAMGENKVTIEHKSAAPSLEDAMKAIEEARAKLKASSVEVVAKPVEAC